MPIFAFLGGMLAVAASRPEYKQVKALLNFILAAVGFVFLGYAVYRIAKSPADFTTVSTAREFTVPLLLTLGLVPFTYGAALIFAYEVVFLRLRWKLDRGPLYRSRETKGASGSQLQAAEGAPVVVRVPSRTADLKQAGPTSTAQRGRSPDEALEETLHEPQAVWFTRSSASGSRELGRRRHLESHMGAPWIALRVALAIVMAMAGCRSQPALGTNRGQSVV